MIQMHPTPITFAMKSTVRSLVLVSFVFLFDQAAFANLGQTPQQVEARYGPGKEVLAETPAESAKAYSFHRMAILVEYWKGTSCSEQYQKVDKSAITEAEANAILAASAGPATWHQTPEDTWVRTDKAAIAYMADERKVLVVQTYTYHVEERKNQEQPSGQ